MIPHAPFGEYAPFTFAKGTNPAAIPASKLLTSGGLDLERREIDQVRQAQRLHHEKKYTQAQAAWEAAFAMDLKTLNIPRLLLGKAVTSAHLGNLEQAYSELSQSMHPDAEYSVRLTAIAFQAILADELGHRAKAISLYKKALALLDPHPDYSGFGRTRATAEAGLTSLRPCSRFRKSGSAFDATITQPSPTKPASHGQVSKTHRESGRSCSSVSFGLEGSIEDRVRRCPAAETRRRICPCC